MLEPDDLKALHASFKECCRDPARRKQLNDMLAEGDWYRVASLASSIMQSQNLHLQPWQLPPCELIADELVVELPDPSGKVQAWRLLARLMRLGISPFVPDPLAAIAEAEKPAKRLKLNPAARAALRVRLTTPAPVEQN